MQIEELKQRLTLALQACDLGDETLALSIVQRIVYAVEPKDQAIATQPAAVPGAAEIARPELVEVARPELVEVETCYGCGGRSGPGDPRQPNAQKHERVGGIVKGVHLTVHVKPDTKYRCVNAYLIDEEQAKGQTVIFVSVKRRDGATANERVLMATGYQGGPDQFDDYLEPGNGRTSPYEHTMADAHKGKGCSFVPPNLGPLAIFIAKPGTNEPDSDVVGNLGLVEAHHHCFGLEYVER